MTQARVSIVFGNETITLDGVEKRIPLRLPHLLKLKRLDWYGASQNGSLLFNDGSELQFSEPAIVAPFVSRWEAEPPQPDVKQLKRYIDEVTVEPHDTANLTPRRRWAEIEKRHPKPIYPAALLQLMSTQYAAVDDLQHYRRGELMSNVRPVDKELIDSLLKKGNDVANEVSHVPAIGTTVPNGESTLRIRELERRRMQNAAKRK